VEERGIACAYHGWLYDTSGNCLETPAEPSDSRLHLTVKQRAYPVREFVGLLWAYLGPAPAPEIPRYDVWARRDGTRKVVVHPVLDCNWLQPMENSVDSAHSPILHQEFLSFGGDTAPGNTTAGTARGIIEDRYEEVALGVMKKRVLTDGRQADAHPLIFPNILRQATGTQIRVPIDDTHTMVFRVVFVPSKDAHGAPEDGEIPVDFRPDYKEPPTALHPTARFDTTIEIAAQDHMAWETQGPIADRPHERLATSDRGIVMFREMLKAEIERVQRGEDPRGVIRDPNHEIIDTNLDETLAGYARRGGE
jgi:5,5'-dehydrodivanillate O-demethylase